LISMGLGRYCIDQFLDVAVRHLALLDPDLLDLVGTIHEDLDAELHSELVEVEIETGDFGIIDDVGHVLMRLHGLDGVALINWL